MANRPELAWSAHWPWIVVELATICGAATALWFVRFAVLIAPVATAIWLLAMDVTATFRREVSLDWGAAKWTTIAVGVAFMIAAWLLERQSSDDATEDFAGWWYGAGLFAFWGGITALRAESEFHRAFYALINVTLIAVAVSLRRVIFVVFGALGLHIYIGHLAYRVFKDSFLFPFVVAVLGLSMILVTVWAQRRLRPLA